MSAPLPLHGKRLLITRSADAAASLRQALQALGAQVLEIPSITQRPLPLTAAGAAQLAALSQVQWAAFASQYAVELFQALLAARQQALPAQLRLAAVGPATAAKLQALWPTHGVAVAPEHCAEGLAALLLQHLQRRSQPVLLPGAQAGRPYVAQVLRQQGYTVWSLPLYVTEPLSPQTPRQRLAAAQLDAALFSSPSCVQGFYARYSLPAEVYCCSIGPSTSAALRRLGQLVHAEAQPHSLSGLVTAVCQVLAVAS